MSVIHLGTEKGQMGVGANVLHNTSQGHKANISLFSVKQIRKVFSLCNIDKLKDKVKLRIQDIG